MKKTLLATGLLTTMVLGNVVMAAETDTITTGKNEAKSTNKVAVKAGEAAITAAPSYDFGTIEASDVAKGSFESVGNAFDKENPENTENIQKTVDFSNNTLKDVKLTVNLGEVTDNFLTGVTYTYDGVVDGGTTEGETEGETEGNTITDIGKIKISSKGSHEVIPATDKVGEHHLSFKNVKANYTFERSAVNQSKLEGYAHELVWSLTDGTEGQEVQNTL